MPRATISSGSDLTFRFTNGDSVLREGGRVRLSRYHRAARLGDGTIIPLPARVSSDSSLAIGGRSYRGEVVIYRGGGGLDIVNELEIEDYLLGVLSAEMPVSWPIEALKAQAVAARTFAVSRLGSHDDYDLTDTTRDQVYEGMEGETEPVTEAVNSTGGMILAIDSEPVETPYHSTCGGHTESFENVWGGESRPHLVVRTDTHCTASPYYSWRRVIPASEVTRAAARFGNIGPVRSLYAAGISPSGRVTRIRIVGRRGEVTVSSQRFRMAIGPMRLPSTLFSVSGNNSSFIFSGGGFGHGVGMCQWGARGMADEGADFEEILRFYYPGTEIIGPRREAASPADTSAESPADTSPEFPVVYYDSEG